MNTGRPRKNVTQDLRLIRIYSGMLSRCYNIDAKSYYNYGGRGIEICDEWLNDRNKFYSWATINGYNEKLQIDRIDVNGDYEPSNCRWVTIKENCRNKRNTIYASFTKVKTPLVEIIESNGLNYGDVHKKMKDGFTDLEAVEYFKYMLLIRSENYRTKKPKELMRLKKIIDENYCFMEFKG